MKSVFPLIALAIGIEVAHADVYRCETASGVSYQETPCKGMSVIKSNNAPPPQAVTGNSVQPKAPSIGDEAYRKYMATGDYSRAAAFATTDSQRAEVQRRQAQKEQQCQLLAIRVQEAEANNKHKGGQFQHRAEALQSEYVARCR